MRTRQNQDYHKKLKQDENSRLKIVKEYIKQNTKGSVLNNLKWSKLFESLDELKISFDINLLTDNINKNNLLTTDIYEIENEAVLTNQYNSFIYYLEIDNIIIEHDNNDIKNEFQKMNIPFEVNDDKIIVKGYYK